VNARNAGLVTTEYGELVVDNRDFLATSESRRTTRYGEVDPSIPGCYDIAEPKSIKTGGPIAPLRKRFFVDVITY
jgi:hypothetical protein